MDRAEAVEEQFDEANPKDLIGAKKSPLRLVPPALDVGVAPAMAEGAAKYGPYNWRTKAVKMTVYLEATRRHLLALIDGEDADPRTGISHWAYIGANTAIMLDAAPLGQVIDDRPPKGPAPSMLEEQDRTIPRESPVADFFDEMLYGPPPEFDGSLAGTKGRPEEEVGRGEQDSFPVTDYHFSSERPHTFFERHRGPGWRRTGIPPHRHEANGRFIPYSGPEVRFQDLEGIGGSEL